MRKLFSMSALGALMLSLAACGGGAAVLSAGGTSTPGTKTTPPTVGTITVSSSTASIPADGSSGAAITVVAKDANNAVVSGATISFNASAGNITATQGTTDSTGTAKATLVAGTATAGTTITVTASSGGTSGKTTVTVANTQKTLTLLTNAPQIPSDNSKGATLSAIVKDANNNLLAGVPVSFQVTSGAVTTVQTTAGAAASPAVLAGMTDANGLAQATLTTPGDPTDRTITVNAAAGSATATLAVAVTGTTLSLTGPTNLVLNNTGTYGVVVANSAGQGVPNTTVTLSSAKSNTLSAPTAMTDANGRASFTLKGINGGTDTVTASALGLTQTISVAVSTQSFTFTAPADGTKVNLGTPQTVAITWTNGSPVVGQPVTFAATRGTIVAPSTVNTDASGSASVSISSTGAGPSIVQASGSGVSAQLNLDFVATTPSQISVQAGPTAVPIQGQSTIKAVVRDAANNLVEGATVNFQVVTDPTNGGLSAASAVTDAQGQAQTVYTAGNSSSGANGVKVSATVAGTAISGNALLSVGGQAVFLSFGTGNTIDTSQGVAIYQITYTVFAVDSHGAALPNVPISLSVLPVAYGKGAMGGCPGGTNWSPVYSTATTDPDAYNGAKMCLNEDTDYTGNINSSPNKDYNLNGKLDPGNIAVVAPSSGTTDANGRLDVKVTYPRDHSYWVEVALVASATVQGTQSSTSATFVLQGAVADYQCSIGPPGPVSPYGVASTCANAN